GVGSLGARPGQAGTRHRGGLLRRRSVAADEGDQQERAGAEDVERPGADGSEARRALGIGDGDAGRGRPPPSLEVPVNDAAPMRYTSTPMPTSLGTPCTVTVYVYGTSAGTEPVGPEICTTAS